MIILTIVYTLKLLCHRSAVAQVEESEGKESQEGPKTQTVARRVDAKSSRYCKT